ncbi:diaminobutyrate--2-oxoglutarate transaminase [Endozoicomonas sp. SM1973]|uniref:Diaminobutyrate--2-oxoglutarate transaminase n=1 Tax=Spartinivicinus marinus TaxID=2994442 RepID=A0A853I6G7_9GAMM|nr:diaminobutyrate--2-oxoglutarate transaminase [Spartinivicinus marinus]MCX4029582.1 diaminobutyrate--2-oxoglutarate transaminase [Spartinivicinus marinus]NYZ65157.1 diaminobutyrate--2-oxoglutarate transaminase [Spartinivicinus marinus]
MDVIDQLESQVRSYVRSFPTTFDIAENAIIYDEHGNKYIDFFAGAGTINYGHNPNNVTQALTNYLQKKGILHSLDKATTAKKAFITKFNDTILRPRKLDYKLQFTGPTGTNAVEAAIKLARKVTKRTNIIAFTNGYHGLTLGALSLTANDYYQDESYGGRHNVYHAPYDGYLGPNVNTINYLSQLIEDPSSGVPLPAAIILEVVQGEGGINVASREWLSALSALCKKHSILLIIDDIQVGNGRTGEFFSFEFADITPDIVCLSKAIGGGLPLALLLIKPEIDQWLAGEHTGTFRGNNLAFVAATELLSYWDNDSFSKSIHQKGQIIQSSLNQLAIDNPELSISVRGRGMVWGLEIPEQGMAQRLSKALFNKQLLAETCGNRDQVLKLLPPLTISEAELNVGLAIIATTLTELTYKKVATPQELEAVI